MNLLLDTHTFLWFVNNDPTLSQSARHYIESSQDVIYLSMASMWEMAIKISLGKLQTPTPFENFITQQCQINSFTILHLQLSHVAQVTKLPFHHRDPFDRLIIAQSQIENLTIVGKDPFFDLYGVTRYW